MLRSKKGFSILLLLKNQDLSGVGSWKNPIKDEKKTF